MTNLTTIPLEDLKAEIARRESDDEEARLAVAKVMRALGFKALAVRLCIHHYQDNPRDRAAIAAMRKIIDRYKTPQGTPDDDGWIAWYGGECPVLEGIKVDFRVRSGFSITNYNASRLSWYRTGGQSDIIAYRICKGE